MSEGVQRPIIIQHAEWGGRDPVGSERRVWAVKQVAEGTPVMRVHPTPASVLRAIVEHVATLAQRRELMERAVTRIMVEVRAG